MTGTNGGWVPKAARWPEVTTDIAVGQMRAFEFDAVTGDWAIHRHKSHHTMNAMGHSVPTMIGVVHRSVAEKITKLVPDYRVMGERGMAEMEMPLPDNTLPMMTGSGPPRRHRHGRQRWLGEALAFAAIAGFALTCSLVSHAAGGDSLAPVLIDCVHLLTISLWAGEVFVSAAVTLRGTLPRRGTARLEIARYIEGLSTTATWALGTVVVTGAISAWSSLNGRPAALLMPPYGLILLVKLGLFAVAVAMGGYNRWAVMPTLLAALRLPAAPIRPHLIRFRNILQLESLVLLGVLVAATMLGTSEPPSAA